MLKIQNHKVTYDRNGKAKSAGTIESIHSAHAASRKQQVSTGTPLQFAPLRMIVVQYYKCNNDSKNENNRRRENVLTPAFSNWNAAVVAPAMRKTIKIMKEIQ